ncbi:MAG: DMT family transporter [Pseudomonadota bacterium]
MSRIAPVDLALVLAIGVFWGFNWPAVKIALGDFQPWTLRAIGLGAGAGLLAAIAATRGEDLRFPADRRGRVIAAGILSIFGFNIFAAFGQLLTETSKAAIIAFTMPVWAMLLSALTLGERVTQAKLLALALGMGGLTVLAAEDHWAALARPAGAAVMLCAAVSWAAGTVLLKTLGPSSAPIARAAWMVGISALLAAAGALLVETPWQQTMPSTPGLTALVYHIVFPMTACHAAWILLVARQSVAVATLGTLLVPVVGVLSASLILGDDLTFNRLAALALVTLAIAVALRAPGRDRR